jgi:hypothetical protein
MDIQMEMFYNNYKRNNIFKIYTLTQSRRAVIIALQTSGKSIEMDDLNFLNKYIKPPSESAMARCLYVTAKLLCAGIACQKEVFF